ncbi:hypothetical protein [Haliangium sp.]|uniref:hypothetical protein n=1 Tax=Haliangium sp. TaxID=2663208 RepID=UPI003D0F4233
MRAFAAAIEHRLDGGEIDALVLNAGGQGLGRTAEGYDGVLVVNETAQAWSGSLGNPLRVPLAAPCHSARSRRQIDNYIV